MRKKLTAVCLSVLLALTLAACSETGPAGGEIEYPAYADDREVLLSAYMNPWQCTDEQYQWVQESGLNHLYINRSSNENADTMRSAIEMCEKYGIKTVPMTCWGSPFEDSKSFDQYPIDMHEYPGFSGFNIMDEPKYEDFDALAAEYQKYQVEYPDAVFYTNLLRPGGSKSNLSYAKNVTYDKYISTFVEKVIAPITGKKTMSVTLYPLLIDVVTGQKSVQVTHLNDLGTFALAAQGAGAEMYHFVQSMSFGYNNGNPHHLPSEADIRFQIYSGMAFGAKGWQYFTYATPNASYEFTASDYGMINRDNKRTSVYYGVQQVNSEITKFDHVFLRFDWRATMLVDGAKAETENPGFELFRSNDSYPLVESTEALAAAQASQDTLIGVLNDGERDGYVVVNYTHPSYDLSDEISLSFPDARAVIVYIDGEEHRFTRDDEQFKRGVLTITLDPGEGIFVIPVA